MSNTILFYSSLLFCAAGVFISRLLVLHIIDKNNPVTEKWCKVNGKFNCNTVLTSSFSKIGKYTHLADIALVYYLTVLLLTILSFINGFKEIFLAIAFFPSIMLFAFTFFFCFISHLFSKAGAGYVYCLLLLYGFNN